MKSIKIIGFTALLWLPCAATAQSKAATDSITYLMTLDCRLAVLHLDQLIILADSLPAERCQQLPALAQLAFPMLTVRGLADLKALGQSGWKREAAIEKVLAPIQAYWKSKGMQLYLRSYLEVMLGNGK